jgi:hypothetical protein
LASWILGRSDLLTYHIKQRMAAAVVAAAIAHKNLMAQ